MQYKVLQFEVKPEAVSFWSIKQIPKEEKLVSMEDKINELAQEGWRVKQMSTSPMISGSVNCGGSSYGYYVVIIMEKE